MIRGALLAACVAVVAPMAVIALAAGSAHADKPASPAAPTLDDTLKAMAKAPGLSARFREEKQIALLAVPLKSEGTIHFAPGRGLARHTTTPSPESALVTDKDLVFWDGKTTRSVSLSSSPTLATFARAFSLLLTANRPALEQSFTLDFRPVSAASADAGPGGWTLDLAPLEPDLKKVLQSIHIEGRGIVLSILTVHETNGDTTTTHFTDVDTNRQYTAAEADGIFRVPPAIPPQPPPG